MTYDQFEDYNRKQAEIQAREQQRFWDNILREQRKISNPPLEVDPTQTVMETVWLISLLGKPLRILGRLLCLHDIAPPWRAWRKKTALIAGITFGIGVLWAMLGTNNTDGLAWIVRFFSMLVIVFVTIPRTVIILGILIGILGIYVEFIAK